MTTRRRGRGEKKKRMMMISIDGQKRRLRNGRRNGCKNQNDLSALQ